MVDHYRQASFGDYELVRELAGRVAARLSDRSDQAEAEGRPLDDADVRALTRALITGQIDNLAGREVAGGQLAGEDRRVLAQAVFDHIHGLGRIQPLIDDPQVTDIHIDGHDNVWLRLAGEADPVQGPPVADSDGELIELLQQAAHNLGRTERSFDTDAWQLDLQLPSGARLHAIQAVADRPAVSIRCHDFAINRLEHLRERDAIDGQLQAFLAAAVQARANLVISGGTNTGKTTTVRCLLNEVPAKERLVVCESQSELAMNHFLDEHPNQVSLVCRDANTENTGAVTLSELVYESLRMDPDRVVVGEVRGAEALPAIKAMTQGNDGSMSTMHAPNANVALARLPAYATEAEACPSEFGLKTLVATAVDFVVHLGWVEGRRQVTEVCHVADRLDGDNQFKVASLWEPGPDGHPQRTNWGPTDEMARRLAEAGFEVGRP